MLEKLKLGQRGRSMGDYFTVVDVFKRKKNVIYEMRFRSYDGRRYFSEFCTHAILSKEIEQYETHVFKMKKQTTTTATTKGTT